MLTCPSNKLVHYSDINREFSENSLLIYSVTVSLNTADWKYMTYTKVFFNQHRLFILVVLEAKNVSLQKCEVKLLLNCIDISDV